MDLFWFLMAQILFLFALIYFILFKNLLNDFEFLCHRIGTYYKYYGALPNFNINNAIQQ